MADLRVGEKIVFLLFHVFQVPYIPASKAQVNNVMNLLKGRKGGLVDLGSGDGRIVSINRVIFNYYSCSSIFIFFFPLSHCSHFNPKGTGSPSAGLLSSCWLRAQPLAYLLVPLSCMEIGSS